MRVNLNAEKVEKIPKKLTETIDIILSFEIKLRET